MENLEIQREFAERLLHRKAFKLNTKEPFDWSGGLKSPIYCDTRIMMSHVSDRNFIKKKLIDFINERKNTVNFIEAVGGVATGGITMAGIIADNLNMPSFYIRPKPKGHGMKNQIEGELATNSSLCLIEDLIASGKSSLDCIKFLKSLGYDVRMLFSFFNYGFKQAEYNFKIWNIPVYSLTNLKVLCEVASETHRIRPHEIEIIKQFSKDPENWYHLYWAP